MAYSYRASKNNNSGSNSRMTSGQAGNTTRPSTYSYRTASHYGADAIEEGSRRVSSRMPNLEDVHAVSNYLQNYYDTLNRATDFASSAPGTGRTVTDYQPIQNELSGFTNQRNDMLDTIRRVYGNDSDAEQMLNDLSSYQNMLGTAMTDQMSYYASQTPAGNSEYEGKTLEEMNEIISNLENAREEARRNGRDTTAADNLLRNANQYVRDNGRRLSFSVSSRDATQLAEDLEAQRDAARQGLLSGAVDAVRGSDGVLDAGRNIVDYVRDTYQTDRRQTSEIENLQNRVTAEQERAEREQTQRELNARATGQAVPTGGPITSESSGNDVLVHYGFDPSYANVDREVSAEDARARMAEINQILPTLHITYDGAYDGLPDADARYDLDARTYEDLSREYDRLFAVAWEYDQQQILDSVSDDLREAILSGDNIGAVRRQLHNLGYNRTQINDVINYGKRLRDEEEMQNYIRTWENYLSGNNQNDRLTSSIPALQNALDALESSAVGQANRRFREGVSRVVNPIAGTLVPRTLASLTSGVAFADALIQNTLHPMRPINWNTAMQRWASTDEIISDAVMNSYDITDRNGTDWFDKGYSFATSTIDSVTAGLLATATGGIAGRLGAGAEVAEAVSHLVNSASFFGSAAQSYARDAIANGATDSQALMGAIYAGTAEAMFEDFSFGAFYDGSVGLGAIDEAMKHTLIDMGINASEEFNTEVANILTDWLVMGGISDWSVMYQNYLDAGYTEKEARGLTFGAMAGRAIEAGVSGALQGGVMNAVSTMRARAGTANLGRAISAEGRALLSERTGRDLANASNFDIGAAFSEVYEATRRDLVGNETIKSYLRELKVSPENTERMTSIIRRVLNGETLTRDEFAFLNSDKASQDAWRDVMERKANTLGGQLAAQADANRRLVALAASTGNKMMTLSAVMDVARVTPPTTYDIAQEYTSDTGYREALSRGSLSENAAQMRSNLYAAETARVEQENIGRRERQEAEVTPISEETFSNQFSAAYNTGRAYYDRTAEQRAKVVNDYGEWAGTAFDLGAAEVRALDLRGAARARTAGTVTDITQAELQKLFKNGGAIAPSSRNSAELAKMPKSERDAYYRRKAERKVVEYVAKAVGVKVVLYESTSEKTANGWYDHATGTIYLDVKAGDFGNRSMLRAMAHELTHLIQTRSKSEYAALRSFILDKYFDGKQELLDRRVNEAMENDPSLKPEYALDEVIADSCEMMLRDSEAIKQIYNENRGLFNRIKDFIDKVANAIKKAFEGVDTYSEAANDMREYWGEIQKLWDAGLVAASQSEEQSGEGDGRDQSSVQYSFRGVNRDGRRVYESSFPAGMTEEERKDEFRKRVAAIFNLARVELATSNKRIVILGDKYTEKKNLGKYGQTDDLNARINALYDLADILETSEYVRRTTEEEIEPSFADPSVKPKNDAHRGVTYWYKFGNKIVLDGVPYDVTFSIRDMKRGEQFAYLAQFAPKQNGTQGTETPGNPETRDPTQFLESDKSIPQISGVVNPRLNEKTAMQIAMEEAGLIDENGRSTIQSSSRRSRLSSIDMVDAIDNYDGIDESVAQSLRDVKELYSKYRDNQREVARINEELRGDTQNKGSLEKRKVSLLKTRDNLSYQIDAIMEQKGVRDFLEAERTEMVSLFEESAGAGRDYVNRYYNAPMRQAIEAERNQTAAAREQTRLVREAGQERLDAAEQEWRERFAKLRQRYSDSKLRALERQAEEMRMSFRERMERQQERTASRALRETARNRLARLVNMIETNNDKTHIITELRGPVAKFIEALNPIPQNTRSESARQAAERWREALNGIQNLANENAPVTSLIIEQNKDAFKALSDQISNLESLIRDNSRLTEMGENLQRAIIDTNGRSSTAATIARGTLAADTLSEETSVIDYMNSEQLTQLNRVLRAVQAIVNSANRVFANAKYESRQQMVDASHAELDKIEGDPAVVKVGNGKVEQASLQTQRFLAWRNGTPYYVFKRFGDVGKNLYMSLAKGWGQMSQDVYSISEAVKAAGITEKETQKWRNDVIEAQIPTLLGQTKTAHFTMAQFMSLYCHFRQEQSLLHINGGGFTFAGSDVTRTDYNTYHMSLEEAQALFNQYLPVGSAARNAADFLQHYMQTVGARMGNMVTRALYGYEYFNPDEYYFPVRASDDQMADKTSDPTQSLFALLHMTETRARNPKANSKLVVGDIFDIFNSHMADMAKYKNLALPVLDIVNWLNGRTSGGTIKEALRKAFGAIQNGDRTSSIAGDYVSKFVRDINATYSGGGLIDQEANKFLTRMKKAAVAASIRVALQQPFSYTRAMYTMKPRYLLRSLGIHGNLKQNIDEAMKWSGLARAKSEGAFSSDLSPALREQIIGSSDWRDKVSQKAIVLAEKMDEVTWGAIWRAAKYQVENEGYDGKFYKKGSNEYFEAVRAVFDEVILSTQVMDGTLTRSEFMRDTTLYSKIMTAFMAEPTLTYNMMLDGLEGVRIAKRSGGDVRQARGKLARAMGTWAATQIANALITALVDSFRDDDDYERFFDKFADHFGANLLDNMNPLDGIPLIKTVWELIVSTWQGSKSPLGTEFQGITQSVKALRGLYDTLRDEKTEANSYGKMTTWGLIYSGLQAVSYLSGLPIANFSRTVTGAYNVMAQVWNDVFAPLNGNYLKHITTYNSDTGGYDELFQAEVNGNTQRQQNLLAELAVHGIEGDSIGKEMRTRTRDAFIDGSIGAQKARSILMEYGFDAEDVEEDINFWTFKRDYPGIEKPTSSMANAYYTTFQRMGISAAEFAQYWRYIHGDGITKDEVRTYISSLQIPGNVKAALWGTKYSTEW